MRGLASFQDHLAVKGNSHKTVRDYTAALERLEGWAGELGCTVDDLPPRELQRYAEEVPVSRSARVHLRQAMKVYQEVNGLAPTWQVVRVPTEEPPLCRAVSREDAKLLFKAAVWWEDGPEGLAVLLGLQQGLRRAEIAGLEWTGLSSDWSTLRFVGKGPKQANTPLHPVVVDKLRWWWGYKSSAARGTKPGDVYVFQGSQGRRDKHAHPTTVWTWARRLGRSVGVDLSTHQLRHTFGAEVNDRTQDLRVTQKLLRHTKSTTTERYTRVDGERMMGALMSVDYEDG